MEGKVLAAKELEKRRFMKNGQLDKKIDNEMRIMKDLRHPNIVEFVEYHDQGDYLYIIMEFVRHGDLQGYLNQHGSLKEPDAKILARQILSALSYLHRMKITHRDIKPDNILIADTNPLTVKLSDFGLSKVVKHDETFLKTFCGTLLYCAPEVFPEYETTLTKGTKRRRGTKQQFHSYSSSVDVWSFAGVLWYSLCGKPPFEGIADATGQAMYNNIMATRLDPTPLKEAGISASCIDLLTKMLQTDPSLRPTDRECLDHPWLKNGVPLPQDPILQSIVEEDESDMAEEQLSQLSIREEVPESDEEVDDDILEDEEFESLVSDRQSKKLRTDPLFPRNQFRDQHNESSADPYFQSEVFPQSHNQVEESFKEMTGNTGRLRLFGEIGQSALQSSGILSAHAKEALSNAGSVGDVVPDDLLADNVPYTGQTDNGSLRRTSVTRKVPQLDGTHSSPSLLGAESMVRELNVESPQSPASGLHSPVEPATPKTPEMHQHNSLEQHSSQFSESTPKAKPSQFSRQISLPKTASFYYNPYDPSTHNLEYASEVSGYDYVGEAAKTSQTHLPDTIRVSTKDESFVPAAGSTNSEAAPNLSIDTDIKAPPRRLGKLVATTDSFAPSLTLMIDNHQTSWGRAPGNTIVYDNAKDTRIPKTAFVIFWYSRNGESDAIKKLSQQGIDWTQLEDLQAGIFTNATSGILINGKHLKKTDDSGQQLYGHLHSGDIVQVYQARQGVECLKFKCEFYRGSGKEPRAATESFQILHATRSSQ
jgi:serine/threonine protein kinase